MHEGGHHMGIVVRLDRTLLYLIQLRAIPVQEPNNDKPVPKDFIIGPFFTPAARTIWNREFWLNLPLQARVRCPEVRVKTLKFYAARTYTIDIDVRRYHGDAYVAAKQIALLTLGDTFAQAKHPSL